MCTQPFNKHVKYGLAFVTVTSVTESSNDAPTVVDSAASSSSKRVTKLGAFMLKASPSNSDDEDAQPKVGNLFASFKADPKKSKPSVAEELRASGTLAAMAVKASGLGDTRDSGGFGGGGGKKRKAADFVATAAVTPKAAKKPRPPGDDKAKLPARNVVEPGFDDKKTTNEFKHDTKKSKNVDSTNKKSSKTWIKSNSSSMYCR